MLTRTLLFPYGMHCSKHSWNESIGFFTLYRSGFSLITRQHIASGIFSDIEPTRPLRYVSVSLTRAVTGLSFFIASKNRQYHNAPLVFMIRHNASQALMIGHIISMLVTLCCRPSSLCAKTKNLKTILPWTLSTVFQQLGKPNTETNKFYK